MFDEVLYLFNKLISGGSIFIQGEGGILVLGWGGIYYIPPLLAHFRPYKL